MDRNSVSLAASMGAAVALRLECVDRNVGALSIAVAIAVALRLECVDRNLETAIAEVLVLCQDLVQVKMRFFSS